MSIVDIKKIYDEYIANIEKVKKAEMGGYRHDKFRASYGGRCIKIHQYWIANEKERELDAEQLRLFRLGTIVHEDIQNAVKTPHPMNVEFFAEKELHISKFNVIGTADIIIVNHESKEIHIYDIKTANWYKWRMLFGAKPDINASKTYNIQIKTYEQGIRELYGDEYKIIPILYYYNKDTSEMRMMGVNTKQGDETEKYWNFINSNIEEKFEPANDIGAPFEEWECNYCSYSHICKSPLLKKKRK